MTPPSLTLHHHVNDNADSVLEQRQRYSGHFFAHVKTSTKTMVENMLAQRIIGQHGIESQEMCDKNLVYI